MLYNKVVDEDGAQRWSTLTNPLMYWEGPGGGRVPENGGGAFCVTVEDEPPDVIGEVEFQEFLATILQARLCHMLFSRPERLCKLSYSDFTCDELLPVKQMLYGCNLFLV